MNPNNNKSYYTSFNTETFLAAKELLKTMPAFFNRIYFSSKYANALWAGDQEETFTNITVLTEEENVENLRQIIKTNFLYLPGWDSLRYTDGEDYGFSFIAGNVKYVLISFKETENGYTFKSYDVDTGNCYLTDMTVDKRYFKDISIKESGEIVKTCDFNLEYINNNNTTVKKAEKKSQPEMAVYNDKGGYALTNIYLLLIITLISILVVYLTSYILKMHILG